MSPHLLDMKLVNDRRVGTTREGSLFIQKGEDAVWLAKQQVNLWSALMRQ